MVKLTFLIRFWRDLTKAYRSKKAPARTFE